MPVKNRAGTGDTTMQQPIINLTLKGVPKMIHVDYKRIRAGEPAVIVRTEAGAVICCGTENVNARMRCVQMKDRIFEDGPNVWFETRDPIGVRGIVETGLNPPDMRINWANVGTDEEER